MRGRIAILSLLTAAACSTGPLEVPLDAGDKARDAGLDVRDGGAAALDAGALDAGAVDASDVMDAGSPDAGPNPRDGGASDAGVNPGPRDGGTDDFADPTIAGPFATTPFDETVTVAASGNRVPVSCAVPSGNARPVALVLHGFQIPVSQYQGYVDRLGSHGFLTCTVDFPAGFRANHAENATDVVGVIDALIAANSDAGHALFGRIDTTRMALVGHSLGGKVSFLAAASSAQVAAIVGLDPVDTSGLCDPARCPDASAMLPLPRTIPIAVLGETLDTTPGVGGQACAPAPDNFQTFYTPAATPALEVTVNGANHMDFIDDPEGCGLLCSFCQTPTADHNDVLDVARSYAVAFLARHFFADARYDSYLTGAEANRRWITPGLTSVQSK